MKELRLIKSLRNDSGYPLLSQEYINNRIIDNIEVSIILDLNILAGMERVMNGESALQDEGLDEFVNKINSVRGIYLIPGLAYAEVNQLHLESTKKSFDDFIKKYCPTYTDAPDDKDSNGKGGLGQKSGLFSDLINEQKENHCINYLYQLKIRTIDKLNIKPEEKFARLLEFAQFEIDILSPLNLEVAKYVFVEMNSISHESFKNFCRKIKDNFKKSSSTPDRLLKNCLNSSMDLTYYWLMSKPAVLGLRNEPIDFWMYTGDEGLANLSDAIYYDENEEGATTNANIDGRSQNSYFNFCDEETDRIGKIRMSERKHERDATKLTNNIMAMINKYEQHINSSWPKIQNGV